MIPLLKEAHKYTYIDSYLFELNVVPFNVPDQAVPAPRRLYDVIQYLQGIAKVNNLTFEVDGLNIYLKAGDFPEGAIVNLGFISDETKSSIKSMGWDMFDIAGVTFVECPVAHQAYLKAIANISREPYQLQFVILFYDDALNSESGVDLGTYINTNINFFDMVHTGDFKSVVDRIRETSAPRAGLKLFWSPKRLTNSLNESITTSLTGIIGSPSEISIQDEIPFKTNTVSPDGLKISNNIKFVNAGFKIKVDSRKSADGIAFDFNIENSSVDFGQTVDGLPVVQRRLFTSRKALSPGQVVEIARIDSRITTKTESKLPFLKRIKRNTESVVNGTISVLAKRID